MNTSCLHCFTACDKDGYRRCHRCGTYQSELPAEPGALYTAEYWSHEQGHSTIAEQVYNCDTHTEGGVTKNQHLLAHIDTVEQVSALDIGCAPGSLLAHLTERFQRVTGIEVDGRCEAEIQQVCGMSVVLLFGLFPAIGSLLKPSTFDLIVACDVFEHSPEPEAFLNECARLTKPGGQLLLMLPLASDDLPDRFFAPDEHVFIHAKNNLWAMANDAGFGSVKWSRWTAGHDLISARKV